MNMRRQLMEATADLPTAAEMSTHPKRESDRPKTAVGAVAALSAAKLRIQELEEHATKGVVPVSKIRPNPWQPRKAFSEAKLRELAESIKEVGLMQPVLVRSVTPPDGEEYFELIAGERRWRAHQILEMVDIKVIIAHATDADMAVMALTENISREDLSDYEISKAMRRAEKEFPDRKRMAEAMGLSRSTLYRYLAFDSLPMFMLEDLERTPGIFGGAAASDTNAVLKKHGKAAEDVARELWKQLVSGSLEQYKFAQLLEGSLIRRDAPQVTSKRDIHKVYAGKAQAGSITKDEVSFTVKLKSAVLSTAQEERIRALIGELFDETPTR